MEHISIFSKKEDRLATKPNSQMYLFSKNIHTTQGKEDKRLSLRKRKEDRRQVKLIKGIYFGREKKRAVRRS